ncbi:MAG: hypothetical protein H6659_19805 [Ardenticatenaceae bacterium]|nr:hypothetical protein [Ardenticatenaceae bacterium]
MNDTNDKARIVFLPEAADIWGKRPFPLPHSFHYNGGRLIPLQMAAL